MHKPLHKFVKKYPNTSFKNKGSFTFEKVKEDIETVNTWNGKAPIEDEIKKPTD